jgi:hypothetical protein
MHWVPRGMLLFLHVNGETWCRNQGGWGIVLFDRHMFTYLLNIEILSLSYNSINYNVILNLHAVGIG